MKRLVGYLLVTLLTLSVSAPLAHSAVKPGSTCKKLNSTSEVGGYRYTCVKLGTKLVWNKGTKLNSTSKTVEPAKEIDYSSCMDERAYSMWKLASSEYSNVAKDYGQAYSARIDKGITNPKFGFDDLTFTNKTPCKVKIQVIAAMQCYGPLGSQAYSYSMQSQTGDIQVSASSTITINVERFFSSSKYSCESKPSQFVSLGMRNNLSGPPYLNFGTSVKDITIKVEGADPVAQLAAQAQASSAANQDTSIGIVKCNPQGNCPLGSVGPGGGIVFYDAGKQMSWGRYIEVAPAGWLKTPDDPKEIWCGSYPNVSPTFESQLKDPALQNAMGAEIGKGKANTAFIVANCITSWKGAAALTVEYSGGGKSDWFLPSKDELNELCKFAQNQVSVSASTPCGTAGKLRAGLNLKANSWYWSSTEIVSQEIPPAGVTWSTYTRYIHINGRSAQVLDSGRQLPLMNNNLASFRPVRYFD